MRIRLFGLLLLCMSVAAFYALTQLVALPAADRSTPLEFAIGIVCVGAEMMGLPMLALGAGLFAPTDIPPRSWYPVRGIHRPERLGDDTDRRLPLADGDAGPGGPASFAVTPREDKRELVGTGAIVSHRWM